MIYIYIFKSYISVCCVWLSYIYIYVHGNSLVLQHGNGMMIHMLMI